MESDGSASREVVKPRVTASDQPINVQRGAESKRARNQSRQASTLGENQSGQHEGKSQHQLSAIQALRIAVFRNCCTVMTCS